MARIRTIKPEFFLNEVVASLPYEWRLLFVGLWTQADREGRLEDRPMRLKAALFPYDDLDVDRGLGCLVNASLITRYERGDQRVIMITNFGKHQKPHDREVQSLLPEPDTAGTTQAVLSRSLREGKGRIREGVPRPEAVLDAFERFWAEYPRKVAKDAARKEWLKRSPDNALEEFMIAAVRRARASAQWLKNGGEFIPHPRTWLHQQRWNDEDIPAQRPAGGHVPRHGPRWVCPHVEPCGSQFLCATAVALGRPTQENVKFFLDEHGVPRTRAEVAS